MEKTITIIGVNFFPEDTSTGLYTTQMAEYLSENGFNVSVITGFPYYPQWEIRDEYKDKPSIVKEDYKGIKVYRFKQFTPKNPSFLKRIRHILSFTFGSLKNLKKVKESNLAIAIVPFTSDIYLARKLAKRTNSKVWVHVQDFEFDAAFESGIIKNRLVQNTMGKVLYFLETRLLNSASVVSTISFSMLEKAKKKTKSEVYYLPNWIEEDFINPDKAKHHAFFDKDKFSILYSGNIGAKQDWEMFVEFAHALKDREDVEIVVVGDGAKKEWLVSRISNLNNVKYFPPVPYHELPDLLCSADLHILFQKETVVDTVMPSKLLGMMASAKPSLITGNPKSEVAKVLKESDSGLFLDRFDISEITGFIDNLMKDKELKQHYGINARNYVIEKFSKTKVLKRFKDKIDMLLED